MIDLAATQRNVPNSLFTSFDKYDGLISGSPWMMIKLSQKEISK